MSGLMDNQYETTLDASRETPLHLLWVIICVAVTFMFVILLSYNGRRK